MSDKTDFENSLLNLTPEQFRRAEQLVSKVKAERKDPEDAATFQKKVSGMSEFEFERLKNDMCK
jgi:hypothetical protein